MDIFFFDAAEEREAYSTILPHLFRFPTYSAITFAVTTGLEIGLSCQLWYAAKLYDHLFAATSQILTKDFVSYNYSFYTLLSGLTEGTTITFFFLLTLFGQAVDGCRIRIAHF